MEGLPDRLVVKTFTFHNVGCASFDPWSGSQDLYASQPKKKNKKKHRNNIVTNSRETLKTLSALQKSF